MIQQSRSVAAELPTYTLPLRGGLNPGSGAGHTTPGSFASAPDIGGPLMFSSPDTPGMPPPSTRTAWDFLPPGWAAKVMSACRAAPASGQVGAHAPETATPRHLDGSELEFTDASGVTRRVTYPQGFRPVTQLEYARLGRITPQMKRVAEREPHFESLFPGHGAAAVRDEVAAGRMIIPANLAHLAFRLDPMCIGRASRTKINANLGASPVSSGTDAEIEKLDWAIRWSADTAMDLSTGGNIDECREAIIRHSTIPIGTVPIYSMIIGRRLEDLDERAVLEEIEHQARQGVDYMTIHAGVRRGHLPFVKDRLIGIVSRGGSLLAKWMLASGGGGGGRENLMYELWDEICDILRRHDVSFSIGDGLRPGGLADASDRAQLAELETIAGLTERAWSRGVQVMVEGPGHVPFDQIEWNAKVQRRLCHGAPFYVLGPLVTDIFPGYDHITSCIGATAMAYHGAAMLCYVTPKEHLGLPKKDDVKQGCIAYRIAAHAADVALGIPGARDRDDELTRARAALNWERHFELSFDPDTARAYHDEDLDVDTDFCAMCGHDWCSVRISKEIQEFASGKAPGMERNAAASSHGARIGAAPGKAVRSAALTPEQQEILAKRGVLTPEDLHRLAAKGNVGTEHARLKNRNSKSCAQVVPSGSEPNAQSSKPTAQSLKMSCHSDYVDAEEAKRMQREKLVRLNTSPAHNVPTHDSVI
jgi:phosphomethylpyrimidine synthase